MPRKKTSPQTNFDIPDYQIESLARVLLPIMQEYLSSEQGQKDYAEWAAKRQLNKNTEKKVSQ